MYLRNHTGLSPTYLEKYTKYTQFASVTVRQLYLTFVMQLTYAINKVQLKMLQITSHTAQQTVSIKCKNLQLGSHQPKFTGGFKKASLAPQVLSNGCDVSL